MREFKPEIVIHMAAVTTVAEGYESPAGTFVANIGATLNAIEGAQGAGAEFFLNVTSDKVYPPSEFGAEPMAEDYPIGACADPYSQSKSWADRVVSELSQWLPSMKIVNARAGNVLGPLDRGRGRLLVEIVEQITSSQSPELEIRNPRHVRPWQDIRDILRGYLLLLSKRHFLTSGDSFNFGPPLASEHLTVLDIAKMVQSVAPEFQTRISPDASKKENPFLAIDPSKASRELGWVATKSIGESISSAIEFERRFAANPNAASRHGLLGSWLRDDNLDLLALAEKLEPRK
jgi:CDP-glucose 4,6-dehydratase